MIRVKDLFRSKIPRVMRARESGEEELRRQAALLEVRAEEQPGGIFLRWMLAPIAVVLAAVLRQASEPWGGSSLPFAPFFVAIAATAIYGGFGPGVLASILSMITADYFFIEPRYQLFANTPRTAHTLYLFLAAAFCVSLLGYKVQRSRVKSASVMRALKRQASLIDLTPDAIIIRTVEGIIKGWNKRAEQLYGWTKEEAIGKTCHLLLYTQFPEPVDQIIDQLREGSDWRGEVVHMAKDGRKFTVQSYCHPERLNGELDVLESNTDITEKKEAAGALARLAAIVESSDDAIISISLDAMITSWNSGAERLFGYRESEVIGKPVTLLLPEHRIHEEEQILERLRRGETVQHRETERVASDGRVFEVSLSASALRDHRGRMIGACKIIRDITERKEAEAALRGREELFRAFFENSAFGATQVDSEGRFIEVNDRYCEITGYTREELKGISLIDLLRTNEKEEGREYLRRFFSGEVPVYRKERQYVRKDGRIIWVRTVAGPIRDASGKTIATAAITEDITELRKDEERLKLQAAIMEASATGIVISSRDGNILWANPAITRLTGYAIEEVMGKTPRIFKSGEVPPNLYKELWKTILEGNAWQGELKNRRKDGTLYDEELVITPVRAGGGNDITHFVAIKTDISARKQAEKEKRELEMQAQRAQRLESIGILAGGIAHDFNNLLAGLFGYIEVIKLYIQSGAADKATAALDQALSVFNRAKSLARQLLTFSKGGTPVAEIASVITPLNQSAGFALSGSNIEAEMRIPGDLWPCKIDSNQIGQALDNILINAKEAMSEGGRVTITAANIPEGRSLPVPLSAGNYIRISISDQGCGIPDAIREHIFDPFFSTKESGQGLGLAIAYSIVKKHNGTIEIDSEVNKGTTFHVYIPALPEYAAPAAEVVSAVHGFGQGLILVMDDEKAVQDVAGIMLENLGYTVISASNGEEAIRLYKEALRTPHPFDLVILDLTVRGGLGGKETVKKLLEIDPNVSAIVSSGYSNDPVMENPGAYGFKSALMKPYKVKELCNAVEGRLQGARRIWLRAV